MNNTNITSKSVIYLADTLLIVYSVLWWSGIEFHTNRFVFSVDYLKAQWKSIRDSYRRCLANRKTQTRSGASGKKLSTCKFFDKVPTESNIDLNLNNTSTMHSDETSIMSSPPYHML